MYYVFVIHSLISKQKIRKEKQSLVNDDFVLELPIKTSYVMKLLAYSQNHNLYAFSRHQHQE